MSSPTPLAVIFLTYFILVSKIGPRFMENRKPMKLTGFTRAYNLYQVIVCAYFIHWGSKKGVTLRETWQCLKINPESEYFSDICIHFWYFIIFRMSEFIETIVFVLRKKQNQVSVLHIYHHISTVVLLWLYLKFSPSEFTVLRRLILNPNVCDPQA
jgi:elongation of very long chain fatty acids protein 1